ncbi:hypothetical protein [Glycomyces buryatensis]|uniref:Uncharacterized protein n=1 Tax=Glycomyces buryatensis TaxID=2570927 RepID=A0A4S8QFM8_9ACTN|nr:hypothetical protein [Glycomyces buryatensis]THV43433.1 hypothetical protein FAB82_01810 [Glycomyces buryatensis]
MTYPPQGTPDGQYGPSQPGSQQPPAGGYVPGQAGADHGPQPTAPQYTQPAQTQAYPGQPGFDPAQGYGQQQGYGPQQGFDPYGGQFGPPPVQAQSKGGKGTLLLVGIVVVLMAAGAIGGYFLLGDPEQGTTTAGEDSTSQAEPDQDGEGEEPTGEDEQAEPPPSDGENLTVGSLGALTPIPGDEWELYLEAGSAADPMGDAEAYALQHTDDWISFFGVGVYSSAYAVYDPADLETSAIEAMSVWASTSFTGATGYEAGDATLTETEVDGHPAMLVEMRNSWESVEGVDDSYEDTAILVVDVDGVNGFIGVASVAESGTDSYDAAVEALLATVFDAESA